MSLISGDEYIEIVSSSLAKGIHLFQNIGMLCMQELFFVGWVDYLKHCKWSTFLQKERRVLTRKRTKMSNYFTHRFSLLLPLHLFIYLFIFCVAM